MGISVVAIHGIGANADTTWSKNGVNWLEHEEMLPCFNAIPDARIMRFAYESQWLGEFLFFFFAMPCILSRATFRPAWMLANAAISWGGFTYILSKPLEFSNLRLKPMLTLIP